MSKKISNKKKGAILISGIFFALIIILGGMYMTFGNSGIMFTLRIYVQTWLSLIPTITCAITCAIVVWIGINTMEALKTKQSTNNNKTKTPNKKYLKKSTIIGIAIIITFGIIWISFIASTFSPPIEYPQIYINFDGQVQPPTTQIKQEGSLYTLQADIDLYKFYIEKNDITLDGNGYKINIVGPEAYRHGTKRGYFELSQVKNVTLINLILTDTHPVIDTKLVILNSSHCKVQNTNFFSFEILNSQHIQINNHSKPYTSAAPKNNFLLSQSTNCSITNRHISKLKLVESHHNKIVNNQISEDRLRSVLLGFENSSSNLLFANQINTNTHISFSLTGQTQDNMIVANNFTGQNIRKPTSSCNGTNTFYHNNFNATWLQTGSNFTVSKWNNGQTGNYWSNYNGSDQNKDGVGDTPYIIDQNNQDNYPLTNPVNTKLEEQPKLPPYTQTPKPYTQTLQEEPPQLTLIAIIVIATIITTSLIFLKRKQKKGKR